MSLTKYETETHITFNAEDDTANVFTCMGKWMTMIEKRGIEPWKVHKSDGRVVAKEYRVPVAWIVCRPKKVVSEEQRERMRENNPFTRKEVTEIEAVV